MNEQAATAAAGDRPGRREQNKAENRAALLKAARSVFAEIGYGAAGVRDIVRRTDLASGTFYNYFKDKEEIFSAVVVDMSTELLARHQHGRVKAKTAEEFFRSHCTVYMTFVAADPEPPNLKAGGWVGCRQGRLQRPGHDEQPALHP